MKLDRNINPDRLGKYALIQMRELGPVEAKRLHERAGNEEKMLCLPASAFRTGTESPGDMFFVLKYKDKFASAALTAYAEAVLDEVDALHRSGNHKAADELMEYAVDIQGEATLAETFGIQLPS